ncbi:hypothetical protein [Bacillus sp. V2I10]|uniref:hypothetical protein n=1 Tax=Bacillus sp. V2I10 TaxID=3042276 RepID=UPI002783F757|nr:hypothetical protein [Bacillus sp. V2I10]MDQ0861612.1 hypothetical protein [Bacillus sp. V2I10]
MNIETKYLIRWGIPGWVFILFSYISYLSVENGVLFTKDFTVPQLLGVLIALGFVGVVIGYLMHQIYFSLNWIFTNQSSKIISKTIALVENKEAFKINLHEISQHKAYYLIEYHWHKQLLLIDKDKREYVAERYRYLLTTIHGLGALLVSIIFSFISVLFIAHENELNWLVIFLIILLIYLAFSVYKGFKYYSENLIHFQGNFLNSFLNKEFSKARERIDLDQ